MITHENLAQLFRGVAWDVQAILKRYKIPNHSNCPPEAESSFPATLAAQVRDIGYLEGNLFVLGAIAGEMLRYANLMVGEETTPTPEQALASIRKILDQIGSERGVSCQNS